MRFGYRKRTKEDPTPILLDNLICTGREASLVDCKHNGLGNHNCKHTQDAGLVCKEGTAYRISYNICSEVSRPILVLSKGVKHDCEEPSTDTVEPPNNGHVWDPGFCLCREVVLFRRLFCIEYVY